MSASSREAQSLLPLSEPVFQILLALADGERHGYAIMQEVGRQTGGGLRLGPGTLYGAIKRLREQGLLEEAEHAGGDEGGERRRYYRLTPFGREVAGLEVKRLEALLAAARRSRLVVRTDTA